MSSSEPPRVPYVNLYRFDREKCQKKFQKDTFDDIVKSHATTVVKKCINSTREIPSDQSQCIRKGIKVIFTDEQKVQTQTQVEANLEKTKNAFSIWYFEGNDNNIYVAGEGRSFHYIRDLADHKFPEMVLDRYLDEDVLEVQGERLLGRVALYSEQFRQEQRIMENLWHYLNSLTTKVKVAIRPETELGKLVLANDKKKVFAEVNFHNNSIQIRKTLPENEVMRVFNVLIKGFEEPSSGKCVLLRLISRVRDDPTRQKLNKLLNDFLASLGKGAGGASTAEIQVDSATLHANEDAWNSSSEIELNLPVLREATYSFSPDNIRKGIQELKVPPEDVRVRFKENGGLTKVVSGRDYLEKAHREIPATVAYLEKPKQKPPTVKHQRHTKTWSTLFSTLCQKFEEKGHSKYFDLLSWLGKVKVLYGEKKEKPFLSLLECRKSFLSEDLTGTYVYFHGEWLSFQPRFHSLLEVHFLELLETRSIESNLILPLPWPKTGLGPSQEAQFRKFFAEWLKLNEVTKGALQEFGGDTYKELRENLCSSNMTEPQYNALYLLVDQLMEAKGRGFLVGDGVTVKGGMEIFDLMYYDELNVFFIHVKRGFNSKNMREVVDQVRHSAEYMQCLLLQGRDALKTEMRKFHRSIRQCKQKDDGTACQRHKDVPKRACELNRKCAEKVDEKNFIDLLTSRKLHFVLAYGGRCEEDECLRIVEGREIDEVMKKFERWKLKMVDKGYACQNDRENQPSTTKKRKRDTGSYALTRRFCVVELESFLECMTNEDLEENTDELKQLFHSLKSAISKTELNACKMAFLNLFESFKNIKDMTLWFCRISHRSPDDEDLKNIIARMENMHLWPQG